ncbi:MAG: sce7725 family protein [Nitrospirae bacterium]|nr:sce7725 family protein [Nitrospirota bacterium]
MYYPYFRGKQYELITIRENAERMSRAKIVPIIEPVKQNLSGLTRAVEALIEHNARFVLIVNPQCGELCDGASALSNEIMIDLLPEYDNYLIGYVVNTDSDINAVRRFCRSQVRPISIIHYGYPHGRELADTLNKFETVEEHIFIEEFSTRLYRRHFKDKQRVLIRDGFVHRKNREHPEIEHFSDLHITYADEGVNGFGDYLIVGDEFMESGGPAYAVAIHLTFIDTDEDNDMFVKHYISDRTQSPTDPGGKFLEALRKLVRDVNRPKSKIYRSEAVEEFESFHSREHYPGLGYVKKLSMQHHIELIAHYLGE